MDVVHAAASGCGQAYVIFAAPVDDPAEVMTAFERARTMWSTVLHSVEPVDTHLFCCWRWCKSVCFGHIIDLATQIDVGIDPRGWRYNRVLWQGDQGQEERQWDSEEDMPESWFSRN